MTILCFSVGFLSACERSDNVNITPLEKVANEVHNAPEKVQIDTSVPSAENNYGYEFVDEMKAVQGLSRSAFKRYQNIAIVQDIGVTYPEWPFGDPVEPNGSFVSGVRRYEVKLVKALRGDLPETFSYEVYSEAGDVLLNENPYPLAFCFSEVTQSYVAREVEGQMFDDPGFLQLFLDQWDKAEPVDLSDKPCWFDEHRKEYLERQKLKE